MTISEELKIVEQAKTDIKAFEKLYQYYFQKILNYCYSRLGNKEMAEDITAQVFLLSVEQVKNFDNSRGISYGSWLYRVAHNKIIDYYKSSKRHFNLDELEIIMIKGDDADRPTETLKEMEALETSKKILTVLKQLKPRYQQIISLRYYSDMDNQSIANAMGLKASQVAVVLHRALKSFRAKFLKNYPKTEINMPEL